MPILLQVDFPYQGPWGEDMAQAMQGLAQSIAQEPGLLWKIWTENRDTSEAGAIRIAGRALGGASVRARRAAGFSAPPWVRAR